MTEKVSQLVIAGLVPAISLGGQGEKKAPPKRG
jgi:hypothetical protein